MKRVVLLIAMITPWFVSTAQTGLYKRYASRPGVQAYCVERYPLSNGDSVCVTLLQTDDSAVYRTIRRELHDLPYASRNKTAVSNEASKSLPAGMTQEDVENAARKWRERKHLIVFNADGFSDDKGYYAIYCPSDRMVILAFLITGDDVALKVAGHMLSEL